MVGNAPPLSSHGLDGATVADQHPVMILREIAKMNPSERLELVEEIWDGLTDLPDAIPVTEAQKAELDRRLANYRSNPHGGIPWHEVKTRIFGRE